MKARLLLLSLAAGSLLSTAVLAEDVDPGHPRINQVENRLEKQENNTVKAEEANKITPAQANRDMKKDQKIQNELTRDESKHDGHISKAEEKKMNRQMNHVRHAKHEQKEKDGTARN